MESKRKVVAYLRVSTVDQDTEKNEADILRFANDKDFGKVSFVSEKVSGTVSWKKRKLKELMDAGVLTKEEFDAQKLKVLFKV